MCRSQWNIHLGPDTSERALAIYFTRRNRPIDSVYDPPQDLLRHLPDVLPKFRDFLRLFGY